MNPYACNTHSEECSEECQECQHSFRVGFGVGYVAATLVVVVLNPAFLALLEFLTAD